MKHLYYVSYARDDADAHLRRFLDELAEAVRGLAGGRKADPVGFVDEQRIQLGEPWSSALSDALYASATLMCVSTPRFPTRPDCGRELAAFLRRQDACSTPPPVVFVVRWIRSEPLHPVLSRIQHDHADLPDAYRRSDLRTLYTEGHLAAQQVVNVLARRIFDVAQNPANRLPVTGPSLHDLPDVFHPRPDTARDTSRRVVVIGGRHPFPALAGEDALTSPEAGALASLAGTVPSGGLWLGGDPGHASPISWRRATPLDVEARAAEICREIGAQKDLRELVVLICAPLAWEGERWRIHVRGDATTMWDYDLVEVLTRVIPPRLGRLTDIVIEPFRHWASGTQARMLDLPDESACRALEKDIKVAHVTVRRLGAWRPLLEIPALTLPVAPPPVAIEKVVEAFPPVGPRISGRLLVLDEGPRWGRRLVGLLDLLDIPAVELTGAPPIPDAAALLVLRARALDTRFGRSALEALRGRAALASFDPNDTRLRAWRPTGRGLLGPDRVWQQAEWLEELYGLRKPLPDSADPSAFANVVRMFDGDDDLFRKVREVLADEQPDLAELDPDALVEQACDGMVGALVPTTLRVLFAEREPFDPEHHQLKGLYHPIVSVRRKLLAPARPRSHRPCVYIAASLNDPVRKALVERVMGTIRVVPETTIELPNDHPLPDAVLEDLRSSDAIIQIVDPSRGFAGGTWYPPVHDADATMRPFLFGLVPGAHDAEVSSAMRHVGDRAVRVEAPDSEALVSELLKVLRVELERVARISS